jgi:polyisoprenoid-binding protein YceI
MDMSASIITFQIPHIPKAWWVFCCVMIMPVQMTQADLWQLTPDSEVGFHIDSFGVTLVKGQFEQVQSTMQFDLEQPERANAQVVLDINSISINKPSLKAMVLGPDLFYAEKYKTAIFKSTQFKTLGNHYYQIQGNLTLRGVTRPITFDAKLTPDSNQPNLLNVEAYTVIRRSDFGMKQTLGGIGEKVKIQVIGQWKNSE